MDEKESLLHQYGDQLVSFMTKTVGLPPLGYCTLFIFESIDVLMQAIDEKEFDFKSGFKPITDPTIQKFKSVSPMVQTWNSESQAFIVMAGDTYCGSGLLTESGLLI